MSGAPSSTTPRTNDMPSSDSARSYLEKVASSLANNNHASNGVHKGVTFNTSGGGIPDGAAFRHQSPESDAVTSSDDEEQKNLGFFPKGAISQLSSRRPSYAAEFHTRQRTYSITSGGPLSPTTSHPSTPQGDTAAWAASVSGPGAGPGAAPNTLAPFWGGSIWNPDPSRKSPPKGLNMPSQPPNGVAPNGHPLFVGSEALPSPTSMSGNNNNNSEFPIPIPLQPQFRNYRSMSFSVGQMDLEDQTRPRLSPPGMLGSTAGGGGGGGGGGARQHTQPGLQHRPSRPSLLSGEQFADSPSPLRSVFETEDEESIGPLAQSSYFQGHQSGYSRTKYDPTQFRGRSASAATIPAMHHLGASGHAHRDTERVDEYESALAEEDDMDLSQFNEHRRFSEAPRAMSSMYQGAENQRVENLRQTWQSGGLFGVGDSGAQSRRHSFAGLGAEFGGSDLLGKRNVASGESALTGRGNYLSLTDVSGFDNSRKEPLYGGEANRMQTRQSFSSAKTAILGPSAAASQPQHHLQHMSGYASNSRSSPSPTAPHRGMMGGMPMLPQPRSQQLLYFVTFKAYRGDVFYVQEGTGLRVRVGDLVIVEADRGTDLGTVIAENISWQRAKELKEHYAKEQYSVLMMYASRRPTPGATPAGANVNGAINQPFSNGNSGNSMQGHGHGHGQAQEPQTAELKPKMIKRLAQPHEIQTLRDKEANEAKAKRVCQQKVAEHRLPMEILDAEFQMDWKKLTFYYFADSYINFNSLVTDLFKVYKTRIWMSAMNPASFAHPAGLHQPGSGVPPSGPLGSIVETSNDVLHTQYGSQAQAYPAYQTSSAGGLMGNAQRGGPQQPTLSQQQQQQHGFPSRNSPGASDFNPQNGYNPAYFSGHSQQSPYDGHGHVHHGHGHGHNGAGEVWMGLQGLSLNSH